MARTGLMAMTLLLTMLPAGSIVRADEVGFVPIFDGHTLAGWQGQDMSFWSVEEGAITGTITPEHAPPMNQYLVYQPELVENFELKLESRITGSDTPVTNGGFQYRSRRLPNGDVAGYQVDNNFGQPWKVRLYDEFGRHDLALEGESARFDELGKRHVRPLELAAGARDFRLDHWHEYHLIADGPDLSLKINGQLVAVCRDDDPQQFEPAGVLAMQLHTGPPMKAQFRNLRLKRLPRRPPATPRQRLFEMASLDWTLGDRIETHQPPLTPHGAIEVDQSATGLGAAPAQRVARMQAASLDAGPDWNVDAEHLTVYVRACAADGMFDQALYAKGNTSADVQFALESRREPEPAIGFRVRTEQGEFRADFPAAKINAQAWHDYVGRYNGTSVALYCDGQLMAEAPARGRLVATKAPMQIGSYSGQLERASLWTRALDERQIRLLSGANSSVANE